MTALFRLTAFWTSSSGTISTTNERRAGLSKAMVKPPDGGEAVDRRDGRVAREHDSGERERLQHRERLHDDQQLALVGAVGDGAGPGAEQEHRAELAGGEQAERRCRCG